MFAAVRALVVARHPRASLRCQQNSTSASFRILRCDSIRNENRTCTSRSRSRRRGIRSHAIDDQFAVVPVRSCFFSVSLHGLHAVVGRRLAIELRLCFISCMRHWPSWHMACRFGFPRKCIRMNEHQCLCILTICIDR